MSRKALYCIVVFLLIAKISYSQTTPNRPVIGIMTIPSEYSDSDYPAEYWSYFAASYVKFLESGGAQVIPIPYDLPQENITYLLGQVNGVLFTGGDADLVGTPI